MQDKLN